MWKSQLQTEIKLSSTETEHTGLSYALREAIPLMHLLDEVKVQGIETGETSTIVKCHVLEDNGKGLQVSPTYRASECEVSPLLLPHGTWWHLHSSHSIKVSISQLFDQAIDMGAPECTS